jgi:predicted alpha-1,2-mannosidase
MHHDAQNHFALFNYLLIFLFYKIQEDLMKPVNIAFLILLAGIILNAQTKTPYDYVNPFIGTDDMGHTFPGAVVPFGLVQLSPETDTVMYNSGDSYNPEVYRYCAGYQYSDKTIVGFSHTHFNGTGHSDLGDILLMPATGEIKFNPGTKDKPRSGYRSAFSHENEKARPGYYAVKLDDYNIDVELTASERVGFHKYRFPENKGSHIIMDLTSGIYNYDGKTVWASVRVENDSLVTGYRQTNGWGRNRQVYFAIVFSKPVKSYSLVNEEKLIYKGFWRKWNENENFPERAGHNIKGCFNFETSEGEEILVKVALSGVSTKNAIENLNAEIPGWDFNGVVEKAKEKWNNELSKIIIEADNDRMISFYTSMYHTFINPVVFSDVNGEYRGLDQNIHKAEGYTNYTIFSLWDTYRALHPLFTIIQQKRTNDIIKSMLAHYEQSVHKILPVWSHWGNENWCMIGYHSIPVIADAYLKGIRDYDIKEAFQAVTSSANYDNYDGIGYYKKYKFVPDDLNSNSASKTLEYAYDDWTIYKFAEAAGYKKEASEYFERAKYYRNIFDPKSGFMRAKKSDGKWKEPFDPLSTVAQGFIEGNAWNYSLYVPHDIKGLANIAGGRNRIINWLDSLFTMEIPEKYFLESEDVTKVGAIGNYIHGNEPSHHVPYMYCFLGEPWKTQEKIHLIVNEMYKPAPHGLCGNDDCGQMSAWYIFSALGFYPVAPGSGQYVIGSPCISKAEIKLENGKKFIIYADNLSEKNIYINELYLNNKKIERYYITHEEIMNGGELRFVMSAEPNKKWGNNEEAYPYSLTDEKGAK